MTPVPRIPSIMFHRYNDDLGTLDDVINGVGKIRYSANSNSGFDFSEFGRCVSNFEESFCCLSNRERVRQIRAGEAVLIDGDQVQQEMRLLARQIANQ